MESTTNYSIFKKHESNRELVERNIVALMDSIQEENLLSLRPILVDSQMRVIDGQHRLEAAKRLKLPVFYQMQEKMSNNAIYLLNNNQLKWGREDYVDYYASLGSEHYLKIKSFMKKNKIKLTIALAVLGVSKGGGQVEKIKNGTFKFPNEMEEFDSLTKLQHLRKLVDYLRQKIMGRNVYISGATLAQAFIFFLNCKNVNFDIFMKKLPYRLDIIRPCARQDQYLEMFRDIYNFKNQNPMTLEKD